MSYDILVEAKTKSLGHLFNDMMDKFPRVRPSVWCSKEDDPMRRCKHIPKVTVCLLAPARPPQQFLDDNPTQAVDDEYQRPFRIRLAFRCEVKEEVPRVVSDGAVADWGFGGMFDLAIIPIRKDTGILDGCGQKVERPVHTRVRAFGSSAGIMD